MSPESSAHPQDQEFKKPTPLANPQASPAPALTEDGFLAFWDATSGMVLRGASKLRQKLGLNESWFRRVAPMATKNARGYFFYRVLDEVQKASISLIHLKGFLTESDAKLMDHPDSAQMMRIVLEEAADALNLRCRKLVEVLVELVRFSSTDLEPYYLDYFLIRELSDYSDCQRDRRDFFGFMNRNTASSIGDFLAQIRRNEPNIDVAKRWYLNAPSPADESWATKPPQASSFRAKYKSALSSFLGTEFVAVGKSYTHAYHFSRSIHFSPQETSSSFSKKDLIDHGNRCAILSLAIISRCAQMLQLTDEPSIHQIAKVTTENEETKKVVREMSVQMADAGDFVRMGSDLGRVTDFAKSSFGFYSYEIQYLSRPPIPEIPRDWFAGFELRLLGRRPEIIAKIGAEVGEGFAKERIDELLDAAALEMWQEINRSGQPR